MMTIFLFQSRQIDGGFRTLRACFAAGLPSVTLLVAIIVLTTVLIRRSSLMPRFRRGIGIAGTVLSLVIALIVPIGVVVFLQDNRVGPLQSVLESVSLLWIPAFVVSIPALVQSIKLTNMSRTTE